MALLGILMAWTLTLSAPEQVVPLAPASFQQDRLDHEQVKVLVDGSFALHDKRTVVRWSQSGALLGILDPDLAEDDFIVDFIATRKRDHGLLFWVITGRQLLIRVFDESGRDLGIASWQGIDEPRAPRQFIPLDEQMFLVDWLWEEVWRDPETKVVRPVALVAENGRFICRVESPAFTRITDRQLKFMSNFKLHWLVADAPQSEQRFWVFQQLSLEARLFTKVKDGFRAVDRRTFVLPGWIHPPSAGWNTEVKTKEAWLRWRAGWSRMIGVYGVEDGFIAGYEVPTTSPDRSSLRLCGLGFDGDRISPVIDVDGYLMGVREKKVFVLLPGSEGRFSVAVYNVGVSP